MAGRTLDAALSLLDRQIVDVDGELAGKIDDLDIEWPESGTGRPIVVGFRSGPAALGPRLGRIGRWAASLRTRFHMDRADPGSLGRVSFGVITKIDNHIEISIRRADMDESMPDRLIDRLFLSKIPGARHEAE
jgi:sporulation protein YlmC with PRC-barrel domain